MQMSEWVQVVFVLVFAVAAWVTGFTSHALPVRRRWNMTILAAAAIVIATIGCYSAPLLAPDHRPILRDCLTVALFLVPYWQTGQFFLGPNIKIQNRLLAFDRWLLPGISAKSGTERTLVGLILEGAYLLCYPLLPLSLLTVYMTALRGKVGGFWLVVLVSTYICYAVTPFVPAFPPRSPIGDEADGAAPARDANKGRIFNRWILEARKHPRDFVPQRACGVCFCHRAVLCSLLDFTGRDLSGDSGADLAGGRGGAVPLCDGRAAGRGYCVGGFSGRLPILMNSRAHSSR